MFSKAWSLENYTIKNETTIMERNMETETRARHTMSDFVLQFSIKEDGVIVEKFEECGSRTMQEAVLEITRRYKEDWRGWDNGTLKMINCCGVKRLY
jgi:hypothetical protein